MNTFPTFTYSWVQKNSPFTNWLKFLEGEIPFLKSEIYNFSELTFLATASASARSSLLAYYKFLNASYFGGAAVEDLTMDDYVFGNEQWNSLVRCATSFQSYIRKDAYPLYNTFVRDHYNKIITESQSDINKYMGSLDTIYKTNRFPDGSQVMDKATQDKLGGDLKVSLDTLAFEKSKGIYRLAYSTDGLTSPAIIMKFK